MAPPTVGPRVSPIPKGIVIAAIPFGHASGRELNRTKAVVDATIAKNDTPNTSADIVRISAECPSNGSAAPSVVTPRMIAVERPPLSHANARRQTQGVANEQRPSKDQNALCATAPPPPSRT